MTKYKRMITAILTSGVALVFSCLISLLLTPYITSAVGLAAYGFVSLANNFYGYATILSDSLNSFASRYIVLEHHRDNKEQANIYFSSTVYGNIFISIIVSVIGLLIICFCDKLLQIPEGLVFDVRLLLLCTLIAYIISIISSAYSSGPLIAQKLDVIGIFKTLSYVVEGVTLILYFYFLKPSIWYVGFASLLSAIVLGVANFYVTRKYVGYLRVKWVYYRAKAVVTLIKDGIWTSLNSFGVMLNSGLDILVCNLWLDSDAMGQVAITKTIYGMFGSIFVIISSSFQPMLLKSYADNDMDEFKKELSLSMKVSGLFANVVFAGFFAFGMLFYSLWIPEQDIGTIFWLTVINNMVVIPSGPMQPLYYIYVLTLKKQVPTLITIFSGLVNVVSMYLLIRYTNLGVYAIVWTTVVIMSVINFGTNPLYMAKVLKFKWWHFYPNIIRNVIYCVCLCCVFFGIAKLVNPTGWVGLIGCALLSVVVGFVLHITITFNKVEKEKFFELISQKFNRKMST